MFVVTLSKTSLKKLGLGAMCCALVVGSALLGRFIRIRTVAKRPWELTCWNGPPALWWA